MKKEFVLSLFSGLLLAMAWPTYGFSFLAFFGITPLLILVELIHKDDYKRKGWRVLDMVISPFLYGTLSRLGGSITPQDLEPPLLFCAIVVFMPLYSQFIAGL